MNFKKQFLFSFFFLFFSADAFNITQLLSQYTDFSTFNNYLTQTKVADAINSRQTITILAVDNQNISPLSGKPADVLKAVMSVHVILDYYDVAKLQQLPNKTVILTTLFQTSGVATGQQGFLNATDLATGSVVIGSAAKGSTLGANLVKSIAAQPYNISVLQISTVIIPLGIDKSTSNSSSSSPSSSPVPALSPPQSPTPTSSPTPLMPPSTSPPIPTPGKSPPVSPSSTSPPMPTPAKSPPKPTPAKSPTVSPSSTTPPAKSPSVSPSSTSPPIPTKSPTVSPSSTSPPIPNPAKSPAVSPPMPGHAPAADAPAADAPRADDTPASGTGPQLSHESILMIFSSALWLLATV